MRWSAAPAPSPRSTVSSSKPRPRTCGRIRRSDPKAALDTVARAVLGACFHNSVRPDRRAGDAQRMYADELSDMAMAYLLTPDRRRTERPPAHT